MPKYNPNPLFPNEPLFEIHDFSELPKSPRYTLYCNGQEQTVYHTDSFDYAIVAVSYTHLTLPTILLV